MKKNWFYTGGCRDAGLAAHWQLYGPTAECWLTLYKAWLGHDGVYTQSRPVGQAISAARREYFPHLLNKLSLTLSTQLSSQVLKGVFCLSSKSMLFLKEMKFTNRVSKLEILTLK